MKMHNSIGGYPVLMMAERDSDLIVLLRKPYELHVEFVVAASDGEAFWDSAYFHSADYGGEQSALLAARLRWLYRAGFTADFNRLSKLRMSQHWVNKALENLGISVRGNRVHEAISQVISDMEVGEVLRVAEVHKLRCVAGNWDSYSHGTAATNAALDGMIRDGQAGIEWTTDENERRAIIKLR